ncbi:unnamed protein product [Ectocarpus sp. 6 AP-2014]
MVKRGWKGILLVTTAVVGLLSLRSVRGIDEAHVQMETIEEGSIDVVGTQVSFLGNLRSSFQPNRGRGGRGAQRPVAARRQILGSDVAGLGHPFALGYQRVPGGCCQVAHPGNDFTARRASGADMQRPRHGSRFASRHCVSVHERLLFGAAASQQAGTVRRLRSCRAGSGPLLHGRGFLRR